MNLSDAYYVLDQSKAGVHFKQDVLNKAQLTISEEGVLKTYECRLCEVEHLAAKGEEEYKKKLCHRCWLKYGEKYEYYNWELDVK